MYRRMRKGYSFWQELPPPQYLFKHLAFLGVALEPPNWEPGSWTGAGKAIIDYEARAYLLTARPRKLEGGVRGYAAEVYRSTDGVRFQQVSRLGTDEVTAQSGVKVWSIEGNQLLKDPLTGRWHFYLSVDTGHEPEVGGVFWETMLFVADDVAGPWAFRGRVIPRGQGRVFDAAQARNATIDIVDGQWLALYRATDLDWRFSMGLASSMDGVTWEKRGQLSVDGHRGFTHFATMGTLFTGTAGPVHLGLTWRRGGYGAF